MNFEMSINFQVQMFDFFLSLFLGEVLARYKLVNHQHRWFLKERLMKWRGLKTDPSNTPMFGYGRDEEVPAKYFEN